MPMTGATMRAAVLHGPRDLRVEARPVPTPGPTDVVVEVSHCGVCGTDLHMVVDGWGRPGSVGGHEWSGQVVEVGAEVTDLRPGDPVAGIATPGCGACASCRDHRPSLCLDRNVTGSDGRDGAFAELVCVDRRAVVSVPDHLDLRIAALAEPLAVALHGITRSGARPGDRALVMGGGPIGALTILGLRARGIDDVVVCEPRPDRAALAERLGATVVGPDDLETITIVEPSRIVAEPFDVAIECSGKAPAMNAALCQLRRGGTLVLVGSGIETPAFDPNRILLNELVITGAFEYDAGGLAEAVALLADGTVDVDPVVEADTVGLDGLLPAMEGLADGTIAGKVLVRPGVAPR